LEGEAEGAAAAGYATTVSGASGPWLRLGMRLVKGLREDTAKKLEQARASGPFVSIGDLARRSRIPRHELVRLGLAGALASFGVGRREALWEVQSLGPLDEDDLFY